MVTVMIIMSYNVPLITILFYFIKKYQKLMKISELVIINGSIKRSMKLMMKLSLYRSFMLCSTLTIHIDNSS
jgi:hypothetical protein